MKRIILALLLCIPLFLFGQLDASRIVIFRQTGWLKSAQCFQVDVENGEDAKLCNNAAIVIQPITERQNINIRIGKRENTAHIKIGPNDTLYFDVDISTTNKGILPSDRFKANLILVNSKNGRERLITSDLKD